MTDVIKWVAKNSHMLETLSPLDIVCAWEVFKSQLPNDSKRLDWINRQCFEDLVMGIVVDADHDGEYYVNGDSGNIYYGQTLREAIDHAIEGDS